VYGNRIKIDLPSCRPSDDCLVRDSPGRSFVRGFPAGEFSAPLTGDDAAPGGRFEAGCDEVDLAAETGRKLLRRKTLADRLSCV